MHKHLKIAIEEVDAVIHELLGQEGKGAAAAGDAAIKLMDARERIFYRVAATMPVPFAPRSVTPEELRGELLAGYSAEYNHELVTLQGGFAVVCRPWESRLDALYQAGPQAGDLHRCWFGEVDHSASDTMRKIARQNGSLKLHGILLARIQGSEWPVEMLALQAWHQQREGETSSCSPSKTGTAFPGLPPLPVTPSSPDQSCPTVFSGCAVGKQKTSTLDMR